MARRAGYSEPASEPVLRSVHALILADPSAVDGSGPFAAVATQLELVPSTSKLADQR
ncbi:hypothetical protein D3C84_965540 [compost metagenome]